MVWLWIGLLDLLAAAWLLAPRRFLDSHRIKHNGVDTHQEATEVRPFSEVHLSRRTLASSLPPGQSAHGNLEFIGMEPTKWLDRPQQELKG